MLYLTTVKRIRMIYIYYKYYKISYICKYYRITFQNIVHTMNYKCANKCSKLKVGIAAAVNFKFIPEVFLFLSQFDLKTVP